MAKSIPIAPQPADAEDYVEYYLQTAALTANSPTAVITRKVDTNEAYVVKYIGTNGGSDITLELRNKNDVFGESVNGLLSPLIPRDQWYKLDPAIMFVPGDELKLVATSASGASNIKFMLKGWKVDKSGA